MRHQTTIALTVAGVLALAGCGITDPYSHGSTARSTPAATTTSRSSAPPSRDPAPERGGTIPPAARKAQTKLAAGAWEPTPQATLQHYARLYINWTGGTAGHEQDELAAISLGQARAQALQAAASYARDSTLQRSQVQNTGAVVAIAPSLSTPGKWVVVTSEQTSGEGAYAGLPPTVHVTYAQLTRTPSGWAVDQWQPQS